MNSDASHEEKNEVTCKEKKRYRSGLGPALLIGLGTVLFLNNLGILNWNIWQRLWLFWPLLIVFLGLHLVLGRTKFSQFAIFSLTLLTIVFLSLPSTLISQKLPALPDFKFFNSFESIPEYSKYDISGEEFTGINKREISMDIGAAELNLKGRSGKNLFNLESSHFQNYGQPVVDKERVLDTLKINFNSDKPHLYLGNLEKAVKYDVTLEQPELATDLRIKVGAGKVRADLSNLKVQNLDFDVDVGSADIYLDRAATEAGKLNLSVDVGSASIALPEGSGYKVFYNLNVGKLYINGGEFRKNGQYTSENFDPQKNNLEIYLNVNVGSVNISTYQTTAQNNSNHNTN